VVRANAAKVVMQVFQHKAGMGIGVPLEYRIDTPIIDGPQCRILPLGKHLGGTVDQYEPVPENSGTLNSGSSILLGEILVSDSIVVDVHALQDDISGDIPILGFT
jgi:hypothetical protein